MDNKDIIIARIYDNALCLLLEKEQFEVMELALFCDGDKSLPMQIVEEFLDRNFITIETTRAYTFATLGRNGKAKKFYQKGGFVAEYKEEREQKELQRTAAAINKKYTDFLKYLKKHGKQLAIAEYNEGFDEMIDDMIALGLVELVNNTFYRLTKDGIILISKGLTYDNYLNGCLNKGQQSVVYNNNTNYNAPAITDSTISAPVLIGSTFGHYSTVNFDSNTAKQTTNTTSNGSNISNKNKLFTIFGVGLSAIVATLVDLKDLWEFIAGFISK